MKSLANRCVASLFLSLSMIAVTHAQWAMKHGPLTTRWAADIKPESPLPEYPRPQLTRPDWLNLNGVWEFQPGKIDDAPPIGKTLSGQILVPFPVESAISGVMEHFDRLWYRRSFTVPTGWTGRRIVLHFGAVDYESEIFVNGKSVAVHKGGYDPFAVDVSDALSASGPQELVVRVFDPTNDGGQPRGKQTLRPQGIMYTPCTGIWQTVWIEPVAIGGVTSLKIVPDVDGGAVRVTVNGSDEAGDTEITVTAKDGNTVVGTVIAKPASEVAIKLPDAKLWSPESPFLYDLSVTVASRGEKIDEVGSYFGMRKIELGDVNGVKRLLLNGKPVFQFGPLDQGFWPDGIYTAPTDDALKYDIQMTKNFGFNLIRKHIKVEPARWYYWTDHIGILVWQDMPSANSYTDKKDIVPPVDKVEFASELTRLIENLRNVPSIITWVIFNEAQGQHDTRDLVAMVKHLDPTRLVNQASGGNHEGVGDILDVHNYPPPLAPRPNPKMAVACGEFGGIGLLVPGHMWKKDGGGYTNAATPGDLIDLYAEFADMLKTFRDENGLSAAVYTQTTDVETELNGLLTYDRIPKADPALITKANRFEIPPPVYSDVLATSEKQSQPWHYTFSAPAGDTWKAKDFDDSSWLTGPGGFGTKGTPQIGLIGTEWKTADIWARTTFDPGQLSPEDINRLALRMYHDEDVEVFINGTLAARRGGSSGQYERVFIRTEGRNAIKSGALNTMAIHCKQTAGGQYVDVGIVMRRPAVRD